MEADEIIKATALPDDPASLIRMIRGLAEEILALRAEVSSIRRAALYSSMPDHR
jgi:hypothetical protein